MARFIDEFDVLLLDMGNTFMFGCDRFDDGLADTYAGLGGRRLSPEQVRQAIGALIQGMLALAHDPDRRDRFPRVGDHLAESAVTRRLSVSERELLAGTFAMHEVGTVPPSHAEALRELRRTHRLGLVSNIWSDSDVFVDEFRRAGVHDVFETLVWSSEHGSIKPSPQLFDIAIESMACDRSRTVYIGDKPHRDVAGAKAAGIASVWVNRDSAPYPAAAPRPDLIVRCISELLTVRPLDSGRNAPPRTTRTPRYAPETLPKTAM